jgi:hypothetical protein
MRNYMKSTVTLVAAGALAFSLAACTSGTATDTNTSAPSSSSSSSPSTGTPTPVASLASLDGVDTQVAVDASFLEALTSLGLTPGVSGTATLSPEGVLAFPITGGNVDYYDPAEDYRPYVQGNIEHDGSGFTLTAGDTTVDLTNFAIDPGTSKLYGDVLVNGEVAVEGAYLFNLDGTTLKPLQTDDANGTAILEGTRVLISPDAAALLNETFSTDAVQEDMLVGVAKITVNM